MEERKSCTDWARKLFRDGELHLCEEVGLAAKSAGFSKQELKEARKRLGVKTYHMFDEDGASENWFWYMGGEDEGKRH